MSATPPPLEPEPTVRLLSVPKLGHQPAENEDFGNWQYQDSVLTAAVADGATESVFAGRWAKYLVRQWLAGSPDPGQDQAAWDWATWLAPAQAKWQAKLPADLPWHAEDKARAGACATLLGITWQDNQLQATAIGDSCLFLIREDQLLQAWPLSDPEQFDSRPDLLCANPKVTVDQAQVHQLATTTEPGDTLLLTTDALAAWLLSELTQGTEEPWAQFRSLKPKPFAEWADKKRQAQEMRNDDLTALLSQLPESTS